MTFIRLSAEECDNGLKLVVEDDGIGIPEADKDRMFTRGFGKNTGLGLFLVREILSITGITIQENGNPGTGARFEMTVPKGDLSQEMSLEPFFIPIDPVSTTSYPLKQRHPQQKTLSSQEKTNLANGTADRRYRRTPGD